MDLVEVPDDVLVLEESGRRRPSSRTQRLLNGYGSSAVPADTPRLVPRREAPSPGLRPSEKRELDMSVSDERPVQVQEFEGAVIVGNDLVLPRVVIEAPDGYKRGTILRLAVEVRVKGVRYSEDKNGDMVREHILSANDVSIVTAFDPSENRENVGGSLSGSAPEAVVAAETPEGESLASLGLEFSTSAQSWPGTASAVGF